LVDVPPFPLSRAELRRKEQEKNRKQRALERDQQLREDKMRKVRFILC